MKKFLLLFSTLFVAFNLSAQNYESYLQKAYSALEEGEIEIAQSSYNVYKKMTGKTDLDFETLIKDADVNAWKSSCHIIDCGNGKYLAVQKIDSLQVKLSYQAALNRCKSSRLGGFNDWRLPTYDELSIVVSNITLPLIGFYWTSDYFGEMNISYYSNNTSDGSSYEKWRAINASGEEIQILLLGGGSKEGVYINGKKISSYTEALPKYNYIIIRQFTH